MIHVNVMKMDQMCSDLLNCYEIQGFNDVACPFKLLFVLTFIMEWLKWVVM